MTKKLSEHVEEELFNKEKRVKLQEGVEPKPVKKKKPYYRKKYNKPTPVEVVFEPEKKYTFLGGFLPGFGIGLIIGMIIKSLM